MDGNIGDFIKSHPWLIAGGGIAAAILIFASMGANNAGGNTASNVAGTYADPNVINGIVANNQIGAQVTEAQYQMATTLGADQYAYDATLAQASIGAFENLSTANDSLAAQINQSSAGITNSIIQTGGAVEMQALQSQSQNFSTYVNGQTQEDLAAQQVKIAQIQGDTIKKVSSNNLLGGLFGNVASIFTGGASAINSAVGSSLNTTSGKSGSNPQAPTSGSTNSSSLIPISSVALAALLAA